MRRRVRTQGKLRVYHDVQIISLVGKEWGYSCSSTRSTVVCELRKRKKFFPIVLLIVAVYAEILLQCLVGAFSLSVAFRVISGSEMKSHVESFSEKSEEV
jgi:hypothetical protein